MSTAVGKGAKSEKNAKNKATPYVFQGFAYNYAKKQGFPLVLHAFRSLAHHKPYKTNGKLWFFA
jgi:hypothetical protein